MYFVLETFTKFFIFPESLIAHGYHWICSFQCLRIQLCQYSETSECLLYLGPNIYILEHLLYNYNLFCHLYLTVKPYIVYKHYACEWVKLSVGSIPGGRVGFQSSTQVAPTLGSGTGSRGAVLRAPEVAVAPRGRARSLSRGRPASGPRAEWAGTTAPRSRGALRPAAPGAGGYKWSGGSPSRLSPPRVAAASAAFGLSSLKKKREKD